MDNHVYPAEPVFDEQLEQLEDRWAWDSVPVLAELRAEARRRGLWNLFLPGEDGARPDQPAVRPARRDLRPQPATWPRRR